MLTKFSLSSLSVFLLITLTMMYRGLSRSLATMYMVNLKSTGGGVVTQERIDITSL